MAGSSTWFGWLDGLVTAVFVPAAPAPGSHEARLELLRVGALLDKEACKPAGQRDDELLYRLKVEYRKRQLATSQYQATIFNQNAYVYNLPTYHQCCAAQCWVRQRAAASYRALHDYFSQHIQQVTEELAAAEARRPVVLMAEPALRLDLSGALQQAPERLDMCSKCADLVQKLELDEQSCRVHAEKLAASNRRRGLQAAPDAAAASQRQSGAAAVAAVTAVSAGDVLAGKAEQDEHKQRQQPEAGACAGGVAGGSGSAPINPEHALLPQQPQHACSDQEQQQQPQQQQQQPQQRQQQQGEVVAADGQLPLIAEEPAHQQQQQQQHS